MSVMDIFKNVLGVTPAPVATPPMQQSPTPGNIPVTPSATAATTQLDPAKSPLEPFADLWKNAPIDPKAPKPPASLFANVKPEDLLAAAKNVNFNSIVPVEISARIKAGGEDGLAANAEAMNLIAQNVYAQAAMASTKITEAAIKETREQFKRELPDLIKSLNLRSSFVEENPALNDPALQPLVSSIQSRLQVKHPSASPAELKSLTSDFLEAMATKIVEQKVKNSPPASKKAGAREPEDWDKLFGVT